MYENSSQAVSNVLLYMLDMEARLLKMNSVHSSRYWQPSAGVMCVQVRNDTLNCEQKGIYQSLVFPLASSDHFLGME